MTTKRRIALFAAFTIILLAALTVAAVTSATGDRRAGEDSPMLATTSAPGTSTTAPHSAKKAVKALPRPDPAPADPYAPTPIVQVGVVEIPKIGLVHPVYEGITLTVIDHGPGHWPGSAMPCEAGNAVFPGHRVTHSHPFIDLDRLSPGDQIVFRMPGRDCVYAVTGTQIVRPTDVWVTDPTPQPTVTLIACHPKHSAAQRIVVKGRLIGVIPRPKR
ncbi:MAG TPA: class E sortase [Acidimicrobiia bacterium]|nr:class E sortase [Acidimicrobiia bacterium]